MKQMQISEKYWFLLKQVKNIGDSTYNKKIEDIFKEQTKTRIMKMAGIQ